MPRRLLIAPVLAALVAVTSTATADTRPPASVKVKECSIETGSALFVARIRQVSGSDRMWLRFKLLERGDAGFHRLKTPGLGRWRKSKPGVGAFAYKQAVRGLEAGTVYKAEVDFRWYDADGKLLETATRRSPVCRQFDVLPNLTATPVGVKAHGPAGGGALPGAGDQRGHRRRDRCAGAADRRRRRRRHRHGPVAGAGRAPRADHPGPACTRSVEAEADPDGVIVESSESDNAREVDCSDLP